MPRFNAYLGRVTRPVGSHGAVLRFLGNAGCGVAERTFCHDAKTIGSMTLSLIIVKELYNEDHQFDGALTHYSDGIHRP